MALLAALAAGSIAGFVLGLLLDRLYRDGSTQARTGVRVLARRRLLLLPPAAAGVVFLVSSAASGPGEAIATTVIAFIFLALAATDFERHLLPNRLIYPAIPLAIVLAPWLPADGYLSGLFGAALGFVVFLVPHLVARTALGAGDVKLVALIGAFAGVWLLLPALLIGAILGAAASLFLLVRSCTRRGVLAYGPYLVLGALLAPLT